MEAGLDREQIEALKRVIRRCAEDPPKLRLMVAGLITVVGFFLYCSPQASRLDEARAKLKKVEEKARLAKECRHFVDQGKLFVDRLPKVEDVGDWQDYIMTKVRAAGAKLRKLEPRKSLMRGKYRIVVIEVEAEGMFEDVTEFIDRLERGERIVRLDRISLERRAGSLGFHCVVMGLNKLRG